jgi:hypothetical protein
MSNDSADDSSTSIATAASCSSAPGPVSDWLWLDASPSVAIE